MTLKVLMDSVAAVSRSKLGDEEIKSLTADSRTVKEGAVFFAVSGTQADGHKYISNAIAQGASCVVAEMPRPDEVLVPWVEVLNTRKALAQAGAAFFDHPSQKLKLVGVTGTNGKTTVAFLIHELLKQAWHRCGMLGTVHYDLGDELVEASHTTPDSIQLQTLLVKMLDNGCRGAVMEVSSHALDQERVASLEFDVAVFTNLSQDHLDYHGSMEAYFEAKAKFGDHLLDQTHKKKPVWVVNRDDGYGQRLLRRFGDRIDITTYGMAVASDFRASEIRSDFNGTSFQLESKGRTSLVRIPLIGRHNVYNALAALATVNALGLNFRESVQKVSQMPQVPGRLEAVPHQGQFKVFVDYAHTPDALENALKTLRDLDPGRLIVVFGCGGNRDREKRSIMGRVAEQGADVSIITSDNPRKEDPDAVINDIKSAYRSNKYVVEPDRQKAIREAILMARPRDIVLIAGKGHEATQQFADHSIPFDDRREASIALRIRVEDKEREREEREFNRGFGE